jgi:hypothetical protein
VAQIHDLGGDFAHGMNIGHTASLFPLVMIL